MFILFALSMWLPVLWAGIVLFQQSTEFHNGMECMLTSKSQNRQTQQKYESHTPWERILPSPSGWPINAFQSNRNEALSVSPNGWRHERHLVLRTSAHSRLHQVLNVAQPL